MPTGAIITADIVNSTSLDANQQKKIAAQFSNILHDYKYEFYRGDSFQVYVKKTGLALNILLQLRLTARKFSPFHDIRAGIGIGEINPHTRKLSTATDEAFVLSGRAFDTLSKSEARLIIQCSDVGINHALRIISYFIDYLMKGVTEKQAEVLFELINGNTQLDVAKNLGKSSSTINKHVHASGWHELVRVMNEYEQLVSTL